MRDGGRPSSGFVVRKWKALQSEGASEALDSWLHSSPLEVRRFSAGDSAVEPPTAAYSAKDRVVYNLQEVNAKTLDLPMSYYTIEEIFTRVSTDDWMLVLDIEDGFTGIPVAKAAESLFWIRMQGQRDVTLQRMPFGYSLAPFIFCFISSLLGEAISAGLAAFSPKVFVYMDDILICFKAHSITVAQVVRATAMSIIADFGFRVNPRKVDGPATAVKYLGYELALTPETKCLSMPRSKILTYHQLMIMLRHLIARQIDEGGSVSLPKRTVESLIGKLEHVSTLIPLAKHRLAKLYAITRTDRWRYTSKMGEVPLQVAHVEVLDWFQDRLYFHPTITENVSSPDLRPEWAFFGATDASGEGGFGGFLSTTQSPLRTHLGRVISWSVRLPGTNSATELVGESTSLELKGIILAMEAARDSVGPICIHPIFKLTLATDSQAAHYLCRKGYSTASASLNTLAGRIKELQLHIGCDLTTIWVPREANSLADALSHPDADHSQLPLNSAPSSATALHLSVMDKHSTQSLDPLQTPAGSRRSHTHLKRARARTITPKSALTLVLCTLSLLAFTVVATLDAETKPYDAREIRTEARVRIDALATATTKGYFSAARRFIQALVPGDSISYGTIAFYIESKITSGSWASHNVGSYTTDLLSALSWLALPLPSNFQGKRKDWLMRAMRKARGSRGPRKRKYFSIRRLQRITCFLRDQARGKKTSLPAAAAWLGFLGTMRSNEIRKLRQKHIKPLPRSGQPNRFRIRISDKMHPHNNRRIVVPILDSWKVDAKRLQRRLASLQRNDRVFRKKEWTSLLRALRAHNRKAGNLRPAGNTFWIESEARGEVITANGGWSQKSTVPGRHYTTVTGAIAAKLKASAEARIARSRVTNSGGTSRPRR